MWAHVLCGHEGNASINVQDLLKNATFHKKERGRGDTIDKNGKERWHGNKWV